MKLTIQLDTIEKVKRFAELIVHYPGEADLSAGRYTVDAKSVMGVFSLDLSGPLTLELRGEAEEALMEELRRYSV